MYQNISLKKKIQNGDNNFIILNLFSHLTIEMDELWAVTGGYNLALRGLKNCTNDIDIITTKNGAYKAQDILKNFIIKNVSYNISSSICSYFGKALFNNYQIEIMGEPKNLIDGDWKLNSEWINSIELVEIYGVNIPLTNIEYELSINKLIGNINRVKEIKNGITLVSS